MNIHQVIKKVIELFGTAIYCAKQGGRNRVEVSENVSPVHIAKVPHSTNNNTTRIDLFLLLDTQDYHTLYLFC